MRLILSRKGFDSSAGGCASPILPDGSLVSLPIPDKSSPIRYEDIHVAGFSLATLVTDLTKGNQKASFGAHLDPDLVREALPRETGWRPVLGQAGASQTVLRREGVGPGDLFLFFGWFRQAEQHAGAYRFVKGAPDVHLLWGWLLVDRVVTVGHDELPLWTGYHPHVASASHRRQNTLYIARESLDTDGRATGAPGGGIFASYNARLQLTKPGAARSLWSLPTCFEPGQGRRPLAYHSDPDRWRRSGHRVDLLSASRGQEFVLDMSEYPEVPRWVDGLFSGQDHL